MIASNCGSSLRVIKADVDKDSVEGIKALCRSCPCLIICDLKCCYESIYGDEVIQTAVRHCPLIEVLPTENLALTDVAISSLATIHTLKVLKLSRHCTYTDDCLERVLEANSMLEELELEGRPHHDGVIVGAIRNHCGNVKKLSLSRLPTSTTFLNNQYLQTTLLRSPQLEVVKLHKCIITKATLRTLLQYCYRLSDLTIGFSASPDLPVDNEPILYDVCPSLMTLDFSYAVPDGVLQDILTYCTALKRVTLGHCDQVNDDMLLLLTSSCRNLEELTLDSCSNVTVAGLLAALSHCPTIRELDLSHIPLNDDALVQLSLTCPTLTTLRLRSCNGWITETGILAVVNTCTQLRKLTLSGSSRGYKIKLTPALKLLIEKSATQRVYISTGA